MDRVTVKEDILEEVKKKLPEIDPELISKIFDSTIDFINDSAMDPNVFQINIGKGLGTLTSNFYLNRYSRNTAARERYKKYLENGDTSVKTHHSPYVVGIINKIRKKQGSKLGIFKLDLRSYLEMLEEASNETNKHYYKQTEGDSHY